MCDNHAAKVALQQIVRTTSFTLTKKSRELVAGDGAGNTVENSSIFSLIRMC